MNFNKETAIGAALAKAMNHPLALAMNPNRDEPTVEKNAYANRNHEAKVQPFDLQLKDARLGLNAEGYIVRAFDSTQNGEATIAIFLCPFDGRRNEARYLAEELVRRINNAVD